ncbi:MAG: response regulator [Anaerolineae bacterium]|nr:response regulator [Anaerolineae bacterium]
MMNTDPVVLYVEDNAQSRKIMELLLQKRLRLQHVTIFEDSVDFLARVQALDPKPSIIFLDIHMKPYNGFEMLTMLRRLEWTKGVPIVALTASVMNEEVQMLQKAGFNGCLAKPIDIGSFSETFRRILGGEIIWRIVNV